MAYPGFFITFEGPEGSGKSSQMQALAAFLREQGLEVVATREPGGTALGLHIRRLLLDPAYAPLEPRAEVLLFLADRAQHVERVIRPALQKGAIVLCDRFADSTLAYQGYGHQRFPLERLRDLIAFAVQDVWPDHTFLLDVPPEVGLLRNGADKDRLERLDLAFHQRVRAGYRALAKAEPRRWTILDATRPWEEVQHRLRAALRSLLSERLRSSPAPSDAAARGPVSSEKRPSP